MQSGDDHRGREACYFITFQTVDWVDIFTRPVYKQVIVHSLNHFSETKGISVFAWCLMSHHLHLIVSTHDEASISDFEREYKTFTTGKILEAMHTEPEIRKKWMLERFENSKNFFGLMKEFQVWENCEHPISLELRKKDLLLEHIDFIHQNPVRDKIVDLAGEYMYSSARDYAGIKGLVNIEKLPAIEQSLAASETMNGNFFVKYIRN